MLPPDWRISFQRVQDAYFHFPLKTISLASLVRRLTLRSPFLYFLHPLPSFRTNTESEVALFPATIFPLYPTLNTVMETHSRPVNVERNENKFVLIFGLISCSVFHSLRHPARKWQGTWAEFFEPNKKISSRFLRKNSQEMKKLPGKRLNIFLIVNINKYFCKSKRGNVFCSNSDCHEHFCRLSNLISFHDVWCIVWMLKI